MKKFTLFLVCLGFIMGCLRQVEKPKPPATAEPSATVESSKSALHPKFKQLLEEIKDDLSGSLKFDNNRCDGQVMPWIENALDHLENGANFTAEVAAHGMGNVPVSGVPKDPKELIKKFTSDGVRCGMPDLIARMKRGRKNFVPMDAATISKVEGMLEDLRKAYPQARNL